MRDAITGTPAASASRAPMPLVSSQTDGKHQRVERREHPRHVGVRDWRHAW